MKQRCNNPNTMHYEDYGGRGIKVCEEWSSDYTIFKSWAIENGYKDGLTIERKDVDGDYCPKNCIFADWLVQARNRRNAATVFHDGVEYTLQELSEKYGIKIKTLYERRRKGATFEELIDTRFKKNQYD